MEWIAAPTPSRSRQILKEHPELVSQAFDTVLEQVANTVTSETNAARIRDILHPVLRRARAIGVDAAYDEWLGTGAPPPIPPAFEVPMELIRAAGTALDAGDMERVEQLRRENDALDRFFGLRDTFNRLLTVGDICETMTFIQAHPEIMLPQADRLFAEAASVQSNEASLRRLAGLRDMVERSRAVGAARAAYEAARFWGVETSA